jgi:Transposase zinc-binding domain
LGLHQLKVMWLITEYRTAAPGGHVLRCEGCGTDQLAYNSCRNRHCPKCQSYAATRWLDARQADLLPAEYCQVVFTLPALRHHPHVHGIGREEGCLWTASSGSLVRQPSTLDAPPINLCKWWIAFMQPQHRPTEPAAASMCSFCRSTGGQVRHRGRAIKSSR